MVEVNYVRKTKELNSFKDGANAYIEALYEDADLSKFLNAENASVIDGMYNGSDTHAKIQEVYDKVVNNMESYDKDTASKILDEIVKLDPQIYYDMLVFAKVLLETKDVSDRAKFFEDVFGIVAREVQALDAGNTDSEIIQEPNTEVISDTETTPVAELVDENEG